MENRFLKNRTLYVVSFLIFFSSGLFAQDFIITYAGPTEIHVGDNCTGILDWDSDNTPTAETQGGVVTTRVLLSVSGGYSEGDEVPAGTVVTFTYRFTDNFTNQQDSSFTITFLDTIPPDFNMVMPDDITVDCLNDVAAPPVIMATDNCPSMDSPVDVDFTESMPPVLCDGGSFTRTWRVVDDFSNSAEHIQRITINADSDPPIFIVSPIDMAENCNAAGYDAWLTAQMAVISVVDDGCGLLSVTNDAPATFDVSCGSVTVTFTATDNCGMRTSVQATYSVEDDENPVITPPAVTDIELKCNDLLTDPVSQIMTWADDSLSVMDNCGAVTWTNDFSGFTGGCGGSTGMASVIYTATDECGNSSQVTLNFTVVDNNSPNILTGAMDVTIECDGGNSLADLTNWLNNRAGAMAEDVCSDESEITETIRMGGMVVSVMDIVDEIEMQLSSGCGASVAIEFVYTDACGNTSTTDGDFTLIDSSPPVWEVQPMDLTVECDGNADPGGAIMTWLDAGGNGTVTDGCGVVALTNDYAGLMAGCGTTGSGVVTFTASDQCGMSATATALVVIQDTTPPSIDTPATDMTVECDGTPDPGGAFADWLASNGGLSASDICGSVTLSNNSTGLAAVCGDASSETVTFIATDDCGNTSVSVAIFSIEDTTPPSIDTPPADMTVECDGSSDPGGAFTAWLASDGGASASDICGNVTWSNNNTGIESLCAASGDATITFTATDDCGNTATAQATFTIQDTMDPTLDTPASDMVVECDGMGNVTEFANWLASNGGAMASDDCGVVTWSNTLLMSLGGCGGTDTLVFNFTARDPCGNSVATSASFVFIDTTDPVIDTPASDLSVECDGAIDPGVAFSDWLASNGGAIASDNCGMVTWSNNSSGLSDLCGITGGETVTFTATDECGMSVSTTATFVITDNTSPLINPTSTNIMEPCGGGDDQATLELWIGSIGGAVATDVCGSTTWGMTEWTDSDGNTGIGTLTSGFPTVPSGNCTWFVDVTFTVEDDCGNTSTTTSRFGLSDLLAPVFMNVPANTSAECNTIPPPSTPTATDNCDASVDIVLTESNNQDPDIETCGHYNYTITRTWRATDDCGNNAFTTQLITIEDTSSPLLVDLPASTTVECDAIPDPAMPAATDNCDTMVDISMDETTTQDADIEMCGHYNYTITRTWTATDACGNTNTGSQLITVEDTQAPTFTVPVDITIDCDQNIMDLSVTGDVVDESDNCDISLDATFSDGSGGGGPVSCPQNGMVTRTWVLVDACGNSTTQVQMIMVGDTTVPVLVGVPDDAVIECEGVPDPPVVTGEDNCDTDVEISISEVTTRGNDPAFCDYFNYTVTRTWTATDDCGNTSTQSQTLTVEDTNPPVFEICPGDMMVNSAQGTDALAGNCNADVTFNTPVVTDACGAEVNCAATDVQIITGSTDPNVVVDSVELSVSVPGPPAIATGIVVLSIELQNVDGEFGSTGSTEYFNIIGEDGSTLGQTEVTDSQCGNSTTVLSVPGQTFNLWALDGIIDILLRPYDPPGTDNDNEGINNICGGSSVTASLSYDCLTPPAPFELEYSIDGGLTRTSLSSTGPVPASVTENFPVGTTEVLFYATDCSGNEALCSFNISVVDNEAPEITCPGDTSVDSPGCTPQEVFLSVPTGVFDNCGFPQDYSSTTDVMDLTFDEHPNIDGYVVNDVMVSFSGTMPLPVGDAVLTVFLKGDVDDTGSEFFTIKGEDGSTIGTTGSGTACNGFNAYQFVIPMASILDWTLDGIVDFTAEGNKTTGITASADGDFNNDDQGINPCVMTGTYDGTDLTVDDGGNSQIYLTLDFQATVAEYTISGPTTGNGTFPEDGTEPVVTLNPGNNAVTYQVTDVNGNTAACTYNIAVGNPTIMPAPAIEITEVPNCPGDAVTFTETSGYTGTNPRWIWYLDFEPSGPGGGDIVIGSTPVPEYSFLSISGDNDFYVILTDQVCSSEPSPIATISVGTLPSVVASASINGSLPVPLVDAGCVNTPVILNLFATPQADAGMPPYSFLWTGPGLSGGSSTLQNPVLSASDLSLAGNYLVTITDARGCSSTAMTSIGYSINPPDPVISGNAPVCEGADVNMSCQVFTGASVSYQWSKDGDPVGTNSNTLNILSSTTANSGNYTVTVTVDGCAVTADEYQVVINPQPTANAGEDITAICVTPPFTLNLDGSGSSTGQGYTYFWTGPASFSSSAQNPFIAAATAINSGVYTLVVIDPIGCESEPDFVNVNITLGLPQSSATSNGPVCEGDPIQLAANTVQDAVYSWSGPNGFASNAQNPVIPVSDPSDSGTYTVVITSNTGCSAQANTSVDVTLPPVITALSNSGMGCVTGAEDVFLVPSVFPADNYIYHWNGPDGFSSSDSIAIIPNGTAADNGSYTLRVENSAGCISDPVTTVVDLSDAPAVPTVSTADPLCEGDFLLLTTQGYVGNVVQYTWNTPLGVVNTNTPSLQISNVTAADNGDYVVFVTVDGCSSGLSPTSYVEVNAIPPAPIASANNTICDGEVLQLFTDFIPGAQYVWTGPCQFNSTVHNPVVFPVNSCNSGIYTVRVIVNGCASAFSSPVLVEVSDTPPPPTALNDGPVCIDALGENLVLSVAPATAIPGAQYSWYDAMTNELVAGPTLALAAQVVDFSPYGEGNFDFYVIATVNGCSSPPSVPTSVEMNTMPENEAFAGDDIQVCSGESVILNAQTPTIGTGEWTQISGSFVDIANPTLASSAVNGFNGGQLYTFRWTLSNGACVGYDSDDVTIFVDGINEQAEAGDSISLCNETVAVLNAVPSITGATGSWSQSQAQAAIGVEILNPDNSNAMVMGMQPGNVYSFTWSLSNEGCGIFSSDIVFVSVTEASADLAYAGQDFDACGEGNVLLFADDVNIGDGAWTSLNANVEIVSPDQNETVALNLDPGPNSFVWTLSNNACGIFSVDTVVVFYEEEPFAEFDELVVEFAGQEEVNVLLNDEVADEFTIQIIVDPEKGAVEEVEEGVYKYIADFNFSGEDEFTYEICSITCPDVCASATVVVTIGEEPPCDIPTIFTPNEDGVNDAFVVPCLINTDKFPDNVVSIFNQWGDEVFREAPYSNNWRGTFDSEELPEGTYFYVVDFGDGRQPQAGFLVLHR